MSPWDWLGIDEAASEAEVKRAYAKALRRHRPDEDPEGFQTTHEAYRIALNWARRRAAWADAEGDATDDGAEPAGINEPAAPETAAASLDAASGSDEPVPYAIAAPIVAPIPAPTEPDAIAVPESGHCDSAIDLPERSSGADAPSVAQSPVRPPTPVSADPGPPAPEPPPIPPSTPVEAEAFEAPDPGSRTQEILPLEFDAPLLRRLLTEPGLRVDLGALDRELAHALAALDPAQREWIADRVAAAVESGSEAPAPGVVTVLAEQLDWDMVFLRHRPDRIIELLAADEAHAALQARLQDPATLSPALRALTRPVRLFDRASWPLWFSTRKVGAELMRIRAEAPIVLSQLDPGAVRLAHALLDTRYIGRERVLRWLMLGGLVGLAVGLLLLLLDPGTGLTTPALWTVAGGAAAFIVAAAYVHARVEQVYVLPLEPARQLWLVALLLGLLLLGAALPESLGLLVWPLIGLAAGTTIGRGRLLPGILVLGTAVMLPAALRPLIGPPPVGWASIPLTLLTTLILAIDYGVARRQGITLEEARHDERPLFLLGVAVFLALLLVGAVTEESRKPVPVRPTHSA